MEAFLIVVVFAAFPVPSEKTQTPESTVDRKLSQESLSQEIFTRMLLQLKKASIIGDYHEQSPSLNALYPVSIF